MLHYDILLFSGSSNRPLAEKIAKELDLSLGGMELSRFADSEIFVQVKESVRNKDAYIIQSSSNPANENLMELYLIIDALRRASAKRITAVIPYYGYSRQDRKHIPRVSISAKLVANLLATTGVDRVLALDLHTAQLQGYFDIPVDHLTAISVFIKRFKQIDHSNMLVVSPDIGGVVRARNFASHLNLDIAIIDKRRQKANESEVMNIIGDVAGKDGVLIDDIIDTGGTIVKAAEALKKAGMRKIYVAATHGVFSRDALTRLENSVVDSILVTDSIQNRDIEKYKKFEVLSVSTLLAEGIRRIHKEESVSSLFIE